MFLKDRDDHEIRYKVLGFVSTDEGGLNPDGTKKIIVRAVCIDANGELQALDIDGLVGEENFKDVTDGIKRNPRGVRIRG